MAFVGTRGRSERWAEMTIPPVFTTPSAPDGRRGLVTIPSLVPSVLIQRSFNAIVVGKQSVSDVGVK